MRVAGGGEILFTLDLFRGPLRGGASTARWMPEPVRHEGHGVPV